VAEPSSVDPTYTRYAAEIELYEKEFRAWETRGKKILKLYKDADNAQGRKKRFNVLWSNVQTLQPALYARDPQPVAERRFKDADPVGRAASEVLERCLSFTIDAEGYGAVMRQNVSDRLLPGRGVHWWRYESEVEEDELKRERVIPDYVYWEDFGHNIARGWAEVTIVWRKVYMSRAKLVKRFGTIGSSIPLDHTPKGLKDEKVGEDIKKACIYWIVDSETGEHIFLSKSHPKIIEQKPDEMKLTSRFPVPRPLFATVTTDSLVPTPDYALYQTQAVELEELTERINGLQDALKLRGAYDSAAPELANILTGSGNKLIPVNNWAKFSEKGGIEGSIQFVPIKEVAETLVALYESREKSKQDLYELTGLSDIIRGNSDPRETAKAQQIKSNFAVLRISDSQTEVQQFARDGMRIAAEMIAENCSLETIQAMSGVKLLTKQQKADIQVMQQQEAQQAQMMAQQPQGQPQGQPQEPPPSQIPPDQLELMDDPTWEEVHELLRHQVLREFRIDIETDSTVRTDEDADRTARTEMLATVGGYLEKVTIAAQTAPELLPLAGELLMFGVRSFRSARSIEPVFEDAVKKLANRKPSDSPDPEMAKVQGELQLKQKEMEMKVATEREIQAAQAQQETQRQQLEDQRAERDAEREVMLEREKMQNTKEIETLKAQLKQQTDLKVAEYQAAQAEQDRAANQAAGDKDREVGERNSAEDRKVSEKTKMAEIESRERVAKSTAKDKAA
jgi:hypothetical protein